MQEKIIQVLNATIPYPVYPDYMCFLIDYPGLSHNKKTTWLESALFKEPKIFLIKITGFINAASKNTTKLERIKFSHFLKTINDLCFNNPILVNLKGEIKDAWTHYNLKESSEIPNAQDIRSILIDLIINAGIAIQDPVSIGNVEDDFFKMFIENAEDFIKTIGECVHSPMFADNEQDMCMLFMLCQEDFIAHCILLSSIPISFYDLCHLWNIDLELVRLCVLHKENLQLLLQANVKGSDLKKFAKIKVALFTLILENAPQLTPLIQEKWLLIERLQSLAKQKAPDCQIYLENSQKLISFKTADVPFAILILGDAHTTCYHSEEIVSAISLRKNFDFLVTHPKLKPELFHNDLKDFQWSQNIFMSFCIQSKVLRILIQNPNKIHRLLDVGFDLVTLCKQLLNLNILLENIDTCLELLIHISPQFFMRWYKAFPLLELFTNKNSLIKLIEVDAYLKQFSELMVLYPKHALLILNEPENLHSLWWIKQLKKQPVIKQPKPLHRLKGKYRIVFDLDNSTVSKINNPNAAWVPEFKQKGLYATLPELYIIHFLFIECLRWLHIQGIETGVASAGNIARNNILVEKIYSIAFKNPIYNASNKEIRIHSYEHMHGSPYKNLETFIKPGEDIRQTILVDDKDENKHPNQQANFVEICPVSEETFNDNYQPEPSSESRLAVDHICCIVGLLHKAIKKAEKEMCTLTEALAQLKPNTSLFQYKTYHHTGKKQLVKINPTLTFEAPKGKFFAEEYTLHPSELPLMAHPSSNTVAIKPLAKGDNDEVETKKAENSRVDALK